ncbi:hypothetical protein [Microseira wollei]|uniref:Uncharacterized protein n=1 Tax=Microseira wollei NIES-4236 TaxID=2530354 RepID=A0AAV3XES5_9CYAN|nr:hypothetical protein [Microseira wollei]GET39931.1 hypothetical protein MiSe_47030 [Microseira wollei NIES-4236]
MMFPTQRRGEIFYYGQFNGHDISRGEAFASYLVIVNSNLSY